MVLPSSLVTGEGDILDNQILHGVGDKVKHRGVLGPASGAIPPFFFYSRHVSIESHRLESAPHFCHFGIALIVLEIHLSSVAKG